MRVPYSLRALVEYVRGGTSTPRPAISRKSCCTDWNSCHFPQDQGGSERPAQWVSYITAENPTTPSDRLTTSDLLPSSRFTYHSLTQSRPYNIVPSFLKPHFTSLGQSDSVPLHSNLSGAYTCSRGEYNQFHGGSYRGTVNASRFTTMPTSRVATRTQTHATR